MGYESVANIFSQISKVYDKFLSIATAGRIHAWQRELISSMNPEGNWLDVGTGTGEILKKLTADYKGLRIGIDPALGMLEVARQKCLGCFFIQSLGENLPFKDNSLKNITLSLVFRHLQDKNAFLEEAHRTLEEGGKVGIIDIGKFKGTGFLLFLMKTVFKPVGLLIFGKDKWDFFVQSVEESYTVEEVKSMFEGKNFRVEKVSKKLLGSVYIITAVKTA